MAAGEVYLEGPLAGPEISRVASEGRLCIVYGKDIRPAHYPR